MDVSHPKFIVGFVVSVILWHVVPIVDHDPGNLNEIRTGASGSWRKSNARFARPGLVHAVATSFTLACTLGFPSRNEMPIRSPLDHLEALTSAARSRSVA